MSGYMAGIVAILCINLIFAYGIYVTAAAGQLNLGGAGFQAIGAYAAAMGGLDAVVFTGGIGENAFFVREKTMAGLEFLGFRLDAEKNVQSLKDSRMINTDDSPGKIMVVPTNEELVIALETAKIVGKH